MICFVFVQIFNRVFLQSQLVKPQVFQTSCLFFLKSNNGTKEFVLTGLLTVNEIGHDVMLVYWVSSEASTTKTKTAVNIKILKEMENHKIKFSEKTSMSYYKDIPY